MWRRGLILLVLPLMCFSPAQTGETVPRELVERIIGGPDADVYVGELPPAQRLGFELPVPANARVVGSTLGPRVVGLALLANDEAYNAAVYLEIDAPAEEAVFFYRGALLARGWEEAQPYERSGFLAYEVSPQEEATFCRGATVLYFDNPLYASAEGSPAQVTLQLYNDPDALGGTLCDWDDPAYYSVPIPGLTAPSQSTILYLDGSGVDPTAGGSSSILLESDLGAEALVEHYDAQLRQAGWTARDGAEPGEGDEANGEDGLIVWRRYSFISGGAPWLGILQILSDDTFPQQYLGQVLVIRTAP